MFNRMGLGDLIIGFTVTAIWWAIFVGFGHAQTCGPSNPNCLVPNPPQSDNSNRAAPTKWVRANALTTTLSGDITGTTSTSLVSKIQGTTVTGTTGTAKVVFSAAPTINSLSVTTGLNVAYTTTFAPGVRAPVFIWSNCDNTTLAGQNCGLQVWTGNNPTATPAANNPLTASFVMTNGNNRGKLNVSPFAAPIEAINVVTLQCGPAESCASDFVDSPTVGIEVDMVNSATLAWAPRNRVFNSTSGSYNKIAFEATNSPGVGDLTAAYMVWSASASVGFYEGIDIASVRDIGVHFTANPIGRTDLFTAFGVCALCDDSNSATFAKFGNFTHTGAMIDVSSGASFTGGFFQGYTNALTNVTFKNGADFNMFIVVDSGNTVGKQAMTNYFDRGAIKWQTGKQSDNTYIIFNTVSGNSSMIISASDQVTFKDSITYGGASLPSTTVSFTNNAAGLTATLTNSPTTGNPTKWIPINDNGTTRNIPAW